MQEKMQQSQDPHAHQPILRAGPAISDARLVAILLHGRGAGAEDILGLSREFSASGVTYFAPQAAGQTWYPDSFLAPIEQNEPGISSGLRVIAGLLQDLYQQGVSSDRVVLLGFLKAHAWRWSLRRATHNGTQQSSPSAAA